MRLRNSNSKISDSKFQRNKAEIGAGVSIQCDFGQTCVNDFSNLEFNNNSATEYGASIYYNMHRPIMKDISYTGNTAKYGPDIASYPVRIVNTGTNNSQIFLNDVPSGIEYSNTLNLDLVDYDGQIMNLESGSIVKILTSDPKLSVKGTDFGKLTNGHAELDNLIFIGEIGLQNARFQLTSKVIDQRIINEVLDNSDGRYDNYIDVSFRYCKPGEIVTGGNQ